MTVIKSGDWKMRSCAAVAYVLPWILCLLVFGLSGNDDGAVTVVDEDTEDNGYHRSNGGPVKVGVGENADPSMEPFIATNEWQKVKKGQSVPKGLHVRMNIQTNEIEAKLLDEGGEQEGQEDRREERKRQMVDIQESAAAYNNRDQIRLSRSQIKEVLKNLKHDQDDVKDDKVREEALKKKFRSMDELKEEMKEMDLNLQTDGQIIDKLWEKYLSDDVTDAERLHILQELEYYMHQYDNAQNFARMGGLEVLNRELNDTSSDIRREVALVVASAVQSNPGVQIKAIEVGLMHQLIRLVSREKDRSVRTRVLGATSSLVRHFPYAQKKFVQLGGLDALSALFGEPGLEPLQLKAVTLLGDLLNELNESEHHPDPNIAQENLREKIRQYRDVGLVEALSSHHWCGHISSLLRLPEHDAREKVLATMKTVLSICRAYFRRHIPPLEALRGEYEALSREETDGDYFTNMHRTISSMIVKVRGEKEEL